MYAAQRPAMYIQTPVTANGRTNGIDIQLDGCEQTRADAKG